MKQKKEKVTKEEKSAGREKKYLDMLRDVFVILFLVFEGPVAGVTKM